MIQNLMGAHGPMRDAARDVREDNYDMTEARAAIEILRVISRYAKEALAALEARAKRDNSA